MEFNQKEAKKKKSNEMKKMNGWSGVKKWRVETNEQKVKTK